MLSRLGHGLYWAATVAALAVGTRPPIADGQIFDSDWNHWDGATQRFAATLQRKFPLGSDEAIMVQTLLQQGFKYSAPAQLGCIKDGTPTPIGRSYTPCPPYDPRHHLSWGRPLMAKVPGTLTSTGLGFCREGLDVDWSATNGKITSIRGDYGGYCGG